MWYCLWYIDWALNMSIREVNLNSWKDTSGTIWTFLYCNTGRLWTQTDDTEITFPRYRVVRGRVRSEKCNTEDMMLQKLCFLLGSKLLPLKYLCLLWTYFSHSYFYEVYTDKVNLSTYLCLRCQGLLHLSFQKCISLIHPVPNLSVPWGWYKMALRTCAEGTNTYSSSPVLNVLFTPLWVRMCIVVEDSIFRRKICLKKLDTNGNLF